MKYVQSLFQLKALLRNYGLLHLEGLPASSHFKHTPDFKSINWVPSMAIKHSWINKHDEIFLHELGEKGTDMKCINTNQWTPLYHADLDRMVSSTPFQVKKSELVSSVVAREEKQEQNKRAVSQSQMKNATRKHYPYWAKIFSQQLLLTC